MDNQWAKDFEAKNGRKPTFAEFTAHQTEQASESTSAPAPAASASATAVSESTSAAAAPRQPIGYNTETGEPIYAEDQPESQSAAPAQPVSASVTQATAGQSTAASTAQPAAPAQPAGPTQPPVPPAQPTSFDFGKFIHSKKGMTITGVIVAIIAFVVVGKATDTTASELQSRYSEAMTTKDADKLLKLFPSSQTKSKFAKDGAQQLMKLNFSAADIMGGNNEVIKVTAKPWLLFFKKYQLNITPTKVKVAANAKQHAVTYKGQKVALKEFNNPLFYGSYTFKTTQSSQFGSVKATTTIDGGMHKSTTLSFPKSSNYVTVPGGPSSFKLNYKGKATDIALKDDEQKVGPFSEGTEDPASELSLSGKYGTTLNVNSAPLEDIINPEYAVTSNENVTLKSLPSDHVKLWQVTVKTNLEAFAKEYFTADTTGSWSDFNLATKDFKDSYELGNDVDDTNKYTYKSVDYSESDVISYIGSDGYLYLHIPFEINYSQRSEDGDSSSHQVSESFFLQVHTDNKFYAASGWYE